jgi:hypothetical protein
MRDPLAAFTSTGSISPSATPALAPVHVRHAAELLIVDEFGNRGMHCRNEPNFSGFFTQLQFAEAHRARAS